MDMAKPIFTRVAKNLRLYEITVKVLAYLQSKCEGGTMTDDDAATAVKAVKCCDDVEVLPPQVTVASGRKRKHRFRSSAEASVSKASGYTCKYCCGIGHTVRTCSSLRVLGVIVTSAMWPLLAGLPVLDSVQPSDNHLLSRISSQCSFLSVLAVHSSHNGAFYKAEFFKKKDERLGEAGIVSLQQLDEWSSHGQSSVHFVLCQCLSETL
jgi:hypothetical protein